jgi:uncharacterized coiled-coil protein SlyX
MALSTDLEILNRVLRDLSGCFLQYTAEIWPWTSAGADGAKLKSVVDTCVARQRQSIAMLSDYLAPRQTRIEFGRFSADFTDLHYVSLHFLLKHLIASQETIVESLNRAVTTLPFGDESQELLAAVCKNEQENLAALKQAAT